MNIALIIAGGSGNRMHQDIPKQFINVYDKPVIIYTLEGFQSHPQIDAIEVVCIDGWHEVLKAYAKQFNITKLKWIVSGGSTGQESIRNGVYNLEGNCSENDIVIVHDGIRPLVDKEVLTDVIITCKKYGNAVTSMPYNEQIFVIDDERSTTRYIPRETIRRVATPQAYRFGKLLWGYKKAIWFVLVLTIVDILTNIVLVWNLSKPTVVFFCGLTTWMTIKFLQFKKDPEKFVIVEKVELYTYIQESTMLLTVAGYIFFKWRGII